MKRIALFGAGAIGLGAAARPGTAAVDPGPRTQRGKPQLLVLYGRDWRLHRPGVLPGMRPTAKDVAVPIGRIVDRRSQDLGRFRAAMLPGLGAAFQLHTFDLNDGTILGIGGSTLEEGSYAIVGGTGRYSGATGTYTALQFPRELGGDGTAQFTLNLRAWEA